MTTQKNRQPKQAAARVREHDRVLMASMTAVVAEAAVGTWMYFSHHYMILAALVAMAVWTIFWTRCLSPRAMRRHRARCLRWRIRCGLRPDRGYASFWELAADWSRLAAVKHGKRARPSMSVWARLRAPGREIGVRLGRAQYGKRVYGRLEDHVIYVSPPRTSKSGALADRICDHPGPVLSTSTKADQYENTRADRARLGRLHVFNPLGVGDVPSTIRWDLLGPCRNLISARYIATWLAGQSQGMGNIEWFQKKGDVAFGALLQTAAYLPGATIADVWRWVQMEDHELVLEAVRRCSTPENVAVVRRMLEENRTADSIRSTIELSLSWAAIPQLAASVTPVQGEPVFNAEEFATSLDTLYMIGGGDGDSPITPVFRALASWVQYAGGMAGSRQPAQKLDPPLLMALDEVTQICPIDLPKMTADSAGKGILIHPVVHSLSQLEDAYGRAGAATVWNNCGTAVILPGLKDKETLEQTAQVIGGYEDDSGRQVLTCPPDLIRVLPDGYGLVVRTNLFPVAVKVRPVWKRFDRRWPTKYFARQIKAAYQARPAQVLETADAATVAMPVPEDTAYYDPVFPPQPRGGRQFTPGPETVPAWEPADDQAPETRETGQRPVNGQRVRSRS